VSDLQCWIVYRNKDIERNRFFIDRLMHSARAKGINPRLLVREKISIGVIENRLKIFYEGKEFMELPVFSINRCADSLLSKQMEQMGIQVFNNSKVCEICNDKALTHQYISKTGVRQCATQFMKKEQFEFDSLLFDYPFVAKPVVGSGGNGVMKIENPKDMIRFLRQLDSPDFIVQQIAGTIGKDLRVYILGEEIVAAVLRSSDVDFRANYSLGGSFEKYELNETERNIVQKFVGEFEFGLVGIDFLFDCEGELVFNEIEDSVGCRMLYKIGEVDLVNLYIFHIVNSLTKRIE